MASKRPYSCFEGGRGKIPAAYASTENWPLFDDSVLKGKVKSRHDSLKAAIELYLAFAPIAKVVTTSGVSESRFRRIFRRCGEVLPNGKIVGWAALVARNETRDRQRQAPIVAGAGGKSGWTGAFGKLMADHPEIGDDLVNYLNAFGAKCLRPNKVEFRSIHRRFGKICHERGIADDQYPLNTRERARKALRRWIDKVYLPKYANRFVALEYGPEAGKLNAYGEGEGSAEAPAAPYSTWLFDEVTIDAPARYEFPNAMGDWEELDLARFFQIRLIDQESGATLAVRQVFAAQASADDVAMLFWDALSGSPEVPKAFEGETLLEGAGYPAGILEKLRFAIPSIIKMDRALSHLAGHVQYIAAVLFGARVVLGPARTPHERAQVESRFSAQARRILHQLPGTTGAHPKDPVRKRAAVPVQGRLRAVELEFVLDAYARNENATPAAASFNIAPLERLRRQLETGVLQPRYLAPDKRKPYFFAQPVRVTVLADKAKGLRPYVNYLYMRYTSTELSKDYTMVGKSLLLRPDLRNLRTVMLFREDGKVYGPVQVIGRWGTFPHDQRLRRLFGRLKREGELGERADDRPLEALFEHLRKKAPADRKAALRLTHLVEFLMRNAVPLNLELAQGVADWRQLQGQAAKMAVLPVRTPPVSLSAPESARIVPRLPEVASPPDNVATPPPSSPQVRPAVVPLLRPRPNVPR
jgi:putative transposase